MVVDYVELVGVGDGGAALEEDEPGPVEDGEDDGVAGMEHRVGDQLVHSAQGEQGPLEVHELLRDLQLLDVAKDLEGKEDRLGQWRRTGEEQWAGQIRTSEDR